MYKENTIWNICTCWCYCQLYHFF